MLVKKAARLAAEKALEQKWDGVFPVDPISIAHAYGLDVRFANLRDGVSGAIIAEPGQKTVILVDKSDNWGRQMFTVAHEIGHFVERSQKEDEEYSFVEERSRKYDLHEFYADEFAGNLLMPEKEFKSVYKKTHSDYLTAAHFEVSPGAVAKRRERLGIG